MSTTKNNPVLKPYLFFEGRCEEAIEFYRRALGAEVEMLMRYKESPEPPQPGWLPPGSENKSCHASLRIGQISLKVSDGRCAGKPNFQGFFLSLSAPTEAEADRLFAAPCRWRPGANASGQDLLFPAFRHGTDRFGVSWMVLVSHEAIRENNRQGQFAVSVLVLVM